jgi:acetyltransferase-like isoleucine patch superfamily enzyme
MFRFLEYLLSKLIKKMHLRAILNCKIHKTSNVCAGSHLVNVEMGKYSDIGYDCSITNTIIGSFCSLGSNIKIGGANHTVNWVSTSQVFNNNKDSLNKKFANHSFDPFKPTIIGSDVWISDNVMIKAGITIGDGVVIGMGSVVTKDISSFQIWAGNPAKLIKNRFDEATIKKLSNLKWWEWDDSIISRNAINFNNLKDFMNTIDYKN